MTIKDSPPAEIANIFASMPDHIAAALLTTRAAIVEAAHANDDVGQLTETLKWGEPAYLTHTPKSGTTIRLGQIGGQAAIMVPCSTTIIEDARAVFGDAPELSGKRGLILSDDHQLLDYVINAALTYHIRKRATA